YVRWALAPSVLRRLAASGLARLAAPGNAQEIILTTSASRLHEREQDLQAAADKLGRPLFEAVIRILVAFPHGQRAHAQELLHALGGAFGQFSHRGTALRLTGIHEDHSPRPPRRRAAFLLSAEEAATLWHPPTLTVRAAKFPALDSREFEPPLHLPTPDAHP